jgi:hypothetical protein
MTYAVNGSGYPVPTTPLPPAQTHQGSSTRSTAATAAVALGLFGVIAGIFCESPVIFILGTVFLVGSLGTRLFSHQRHTAPYTSLRPASYPSVVPFPPVQYPGVGYRLGVEDHQTIYAAQPISYYPPGQQVPRPSVAPSAPYSPFAPSLHLSPDDRLDVGDHQTPYVYQHSVVPPPYTPSAPPLDPPANQRIDVEDHQAAFGGSPSSYPTSTQQASQRRVGVSDGSTQQQAVLKPTDRIPMR